MNQDQLSLRTMGHRSLLKFRLADAGVLAAGSIAGCSRDEPATNAGGPLLSGPEELTLPIGLVALSSGYGVQ